MTEETMEVEAIQPEKQFNWRPIMLLLIAAVFVLDRVTKNIIDKHLVPGDAVVLIPGWLRITHVLNSGAAFSLFADQGHPLFVHRALVGFSIFAVVILSVLLFQAGKSFSRIALALAIILGGTLGNLYDRLLNTYVTDFIEVHIYRYHWPDFNVADSAIVVGACLLVFEMLRTPSESHGEKTKKI